MKRVTTYFAMAVLVTALAALNVAAGGKKHAARVVFNDDTMVAGTMVEKGEYKVTFNEETGELTVKKLNGDLVVSTKGHVVELGDEASYTSVVTKVTETGPVMTAFRIEGHSKSIVLESSDTVVTEWFEMIFEQ